MAAVTICSDFGTQENKVCHCFRCFLRELVLDREAWHAAVHGGRRVGRNLVKLKLQYFGHLIRRVDSLEKTVMLGGIGGRRRRGQQRMRWLDGITDSIDGHESE